MPNAPLCGTFLRNEIAWLEEHATIVDGVYRCSKTDRRIQSRVLHRYRANDAKPSDPLVEEHVWASGSGVTFGTQFSFLALWCPACQLTLDHYPEIQVGDLVCISA